MYHVLIKEKRRQNKNMKEIQNKNMKEIQNKNMKEIQNKKVSIKEEMNKMYDL